MQVAFTGLHVQGKRLRAEIERRIAAVFDHGHFIMGAEVTELEDRLGRFCGARETVTVANGTDALQIALMAANIGPGDAVFIPSFTFTATAEVVLLLGAQPVFVDVDETTFNIDCDDLVRQVSNLKRNGGRPRAIIAVDLFGLPANWPRLHDIAAQHELLLIDDAAQSFGGALDGKRVGTLAPITATSFFPAKPLGCYGDGGALFTNDPSIARIMRSIRAHGQGATKYETARVGVNSRLDTIQAAILLAKLEGLEEETVARNRIAAEYTRRLGHLVATPVVPPGHVCAWAQYTIKVKNRSEIVDRLAKMGIPTAVYYPKPMHLQRAFENCSGGPGSLPASERLAEQVLSIPMNSYASDPEIDFVCSAIANVINGTLHEST